MATRKSTRGTLSSRNRSPRDHLPSSHAGRVAAAASSVPRPISHDKAIEAARTKLMRAHAVLECTRYVLLYEDRFEGDSNRPSFPDAVAVARDLVGEVVDALDRVNLRAAEK